MTSATTQAEHKWLQRLIGEWTYENDAMMEPGKPVEKFTGTEIVRSVGGLWIVADGTCLMPDGEPGTTMLTIGYDPQTRRFVGTWIGSMMTTLWIYDGSLSGNILTLESEGPDFKQEGKTAKYRDVIELKGDDERIFTSSTPRDDGKWRTFMTATYRRTK